MIETVGSESLDAKTEAVPTYISNVLDHVYFFMYLFIPPFIRPLFDTDWLTDWLINWFMYLFIGYCLIVLLILCFIYCSDCQFLCCVVSFCAVLSDEGGGVVIKTARHRTHPVSDWNASAHCGAGAPGNPSSTVCRRYQCPHFYVLVWHFSQKFDELNCPMYVERNLSQISLFWKPTAWNVYLCWKKFITDLTFF